MIIRYNILITCLVLVLSVPVQSQDYLSKTYNTSDGLISTNIWTIFQDSLGFIWFNSDQGLSRFDGNSYKNFHFPEELLSNFITEIDQNLNGNILLLNYSKKSLWEFDGEKYSPYQSKFNPDFDSVRFQSILRDGENLYLGTENSGLYLLQEDTCLHYTIDDGMASNSILGISTDRKGNIYLYFKKGIQRFNGKKFIPVFNDKEPRMAIEHQKGTSWIVTPDNTIEIKRGDDWEIAVPYSKYDIFSLKESLNGDVWVKTPKAVYRIVDNSLDEIYVFKEYSDDDIYTLYIDQDDNIWFSIHGKGVVRLTRNYFHNIKVPGSLPGDGSYILTKDKNETIWISLLSYGMIAFDGERFEHFPIIQEYPGTGLICAYKTDSIVYFGGYKQLFTYDYNQFEPLSTAGLPDNFYISDLTFKNGELIAATAVQGIWKFTNNQWVKITDYVFNRKDEFSACYCMIQDSSHNIWVGFSEGLFQFRNDSLYPCPDLGKLSTAFIHCSRLLPNNELWIGTDRGVFIMKGGEVVQNITIEQGLLSNNISTISTCEDIIIIGTNAGITLLKDSIYFNLTAEDGLLNNNIYGGGPECANGKLLITTSNGISIYNYISHISQSLKTDIYISSIQSSKDTLTFKVIDSKSQDNIVLNNKSNNFSFHFDIIDFNNLKTYHRYRINKNNKPGEWHPFTNNQIEIQGLSHGSYKLIIESRNISQDWQRTFSQQFTIPRPIYNTYGSFILYVLLIFGLLYVGRKKKPKTNGKYHTSSLSENKYDEIKQSLEYLFCHEKVYKDMEISLSGLADKLNLPKEHISQVLNSEYKLNFNALINKYRIEEAQHLLINEYDKFKSVIQIAYEVGFNSKSSFNTSFKKHTGCTPTEFRKKHQ